MAENATPTPGEFTRDVGSGEQQGYGEATAENQALAAGDAVEDSLQAQAIVPEPSEAAPLEDVQYADEPDAQGYQPQDEMEEILFGDPEGFEPSDPGKHKPVPNSVIRALPTLAAIVADPGTPPAIKAAYNILLQRMEAELKAKF